MNPPTKTTTLLGILVALSIAAALLIALSHTMQQKKALSIGSFEECALAGYPIMESYPERCATPDGRSFTNDTQSIEAPESPSAKDASPAILLEN